MERTERAHDDLRHLSLRRHAAGVGFEKYSALCRESHAGVQVEERDFTAENAKGAKFLQGALAHRWRPGCSSNGIRDILNFVIFVCSFENTRAWMIYGMKNPEYAK